MQLVEKHIISRQHKFWKECDHLALQSKHLYNCANYTVSRRVIDWCQLNDIGQLVIGNNQGWKQDINIGKKNNQ